MSAGAGAPSCPRFGGRGRGSWPHGSRKVSPVGSSLCPKPSSEPRLPGLGWGQTCLRIGEKFGGEMGLPESAICRHWPKPCVRASSVPSLSPAGSRNRLGNKERNEPNPTAAASCRLLGTQEQQSRAEAVAEERGLLLEKCSREISALFLSR